MDGQKGMQIDLIISRSDRVVNFCEMKFINTKYEVKSDYEMKLRECLQWMIDHVSRTHNKMIPTERTIIRLPMPMHPMSNRSLLTLFYNFAC